VNEDITELERRFQKAKERQNKYRVTLERYRGRLEETEKRLNVLKEKCREKKVDPEKLPLIVQGLKERLVQEIVRFERSLDAFEKQLGQYESRLQDSEETL